MMMMMMMNKRKKKKKKKEEEGEEGEKQSWNVFHTSLDEQPKTLLTRQTHDTHGAPIVSNNLLDSQTPRRGDLWLLLGERAEHCCTLPRNQYEPMNGGAMRSVWWI